MEETVVFLNASTRQQEAVPRKMLNAEVSPMLHSVVSEDEEAPQGKKDDQGRYVIEGPSEESAFSAIMSLVRNGSFAHRDLTDRLPTLEARLQACKYADYYLLPAHAKMHLTKVLLKDFSDGTSLDRSKEVLGVSQPLDVSKLGLCRSQMILERVFLSGVNLQGLQLAASHVKSVVIMDSILADCELSMCVTANDVYIGRSTLDRVKLGIFATKVTIEDQCTLTGSNIRVIEELFISNSKLQDCTFKGSDEDQKDRQIVSAVFRSVEIHGDVTLPFDKISCESTTFHSEYVRMTKPCACLSFLRTRIDSIPGIRSETKVSLCLESCDVVKALTFRQMRLKLSEVRLAEACELVDVEFVDRVSDITFPAGSRFQQVRFKHGLQACIASGCHFEGCNFGYGQDAVSSCLLTKSTFQACRFPFLEADAPVANFSDSNFMSCRIQWSGQFPHEESFLINSFWCRKWNLHGATVSDGH
mmetsp:Transcript_83247/g.156663  ORF Transcript_83247/g.156663 Transcript_83247/m.156663 type:complete len:473 (-) Transcript_83247:87-1505(-)